MKLHRLEKLVHHLKLLLDLFKGIQDLSTEKLAVKTYHIYIDMLPKSYKDFKDDIASRRVLKEVEVAVDDSYFEDEDRRRFAKEVPYVRIDLMRNQEEEPMLVFNAFFFLGELTKKGEKKVTCFQRNYQPFAESYEDGTLGKLFRLMTEIDLLDVYEAKLEALKKQCKETAVV